MNAIFESITDATLRRVYKLVLKRTIGKYLEDELLIDQLVVQSRDGLFSVRNLRLNAELLNEEIFCRTPVKLSSLVIDELKVAISYSSIVSDGIEVQVSSVNAHFFPNKNIVPVDRSDQSDSDDSDGENDGTSSANETPVAAATSEEGREGLSFVGTWIEVIVAKLRAKVDEVNVFLHESEDVSSSNESCLQLSLKNVAFYNADPNGDVQGSSMQLSRSVMSSMHQSTAINSLSATKVRADIRRSLCALKLMCDLYR